MSEEHVDYSKVVSDLEAKREVIDNLIQGFKKLQSLSGVPSSNGVVIDGAETFDLRDIPDNAFLGMTMGDAALKLLKTIQKPLSTRAITEALSQGGFRHTSKNFANTLNTALYRLAAGDDPSIIKHGREWGLREWFPGWRRPKGKSEDSDTVNGEAEPPAINLD